MSKSYVRIRKKLGSRKRKELYSQTSLHVLHSDILKSFSWETCLILWRQYNILSHLFQCSYNSKMCLIVFPKIYNFIYYLLFIWKQNIPSLLAYSLLNEIMNFSHYCDVYKANMTLSSTGYHSIWREVHWFYLLKCSLLFTVNIEHIPPLQVMRQIVQVQRN